MQKNEQTPLDENTPLKDETTPSTGSAVESTACKDVDMCIYSLIATLGGLAGCFGGSMALKFY